MSMTDDEIKAAVANAYAKLPINHDPEWTKVCLSDDNHSFVITVTSAEIEEAGWGGRREDQIKPELRVVSVVPIRLFGKTYTVDVAVRQWWHGDTLNVDARDYGRGFRNTETGVQPEYSTKTRERLTAMVQQACARFVADNPGWVAESTAQGWEVKARSQDREIERAQEQIKKADAQRTEYERKADRVRAKARGGK